MGVRSAIDEKGRLLIPSEVRKQTGLTEGSGVVIKVLGPGEIMVTTFEAIASRSIGMYAHLKKDGESVVDDFIAERRLEAARELE